MIRPQIADLQLEQERPARTFAPKLPIFCSDTEVLAKEQKFHDLWRCDKYDV